VANTDYPVDLLEFTIKDKKDHILDMIFKHQADLIAFSVYIWNVEIIKELIISIRKKMPNTKILLGGPEVSYENDEFFKNNLSDFIIVNEGEISFHLLLDALDKQKDFKHIPNLIYIKDGIVTKNKAKNIQDLNALKDPYHILEDEDYQHKIQYVELSRGCPYQCAYCLASLEKGLRFFSIERVIKQIDELIAKGAKTFKFLDRSFNANHKLAQAFLTELYKRKDKDVIFQFEINGDVLQDEFIDFLIKETPENFIRFEIGVQSTNDQVNREVNRYQDTEKLIHNIKRLKEAPITFHLDLIAGLPYEDLKSFKNTFNTIYDLFADELQLGFLKVLKGTAIHKNVRKHKINYQNHAPYEIIDNQYITKDELKTIHKVETMLNIYWNKNFLNRSIKYLTQSRDAFNFYLKLYEYFESNDMSTLRYNYIDLFIYLERFLKENSLWNHTIESYMKYDYLTHHPIKPKIYWNEDIEKNEIIRAFHKDNKHLKIDDLYKYSLVTQYLKGYLIVVYHPNNRQIHYFKKRKNYISNKTLKMRTNVKAPIKKT
jgi:radical SAM superfamily enzyme YgiQ (UPF0313 family)